MKAGEGLLTIGTRVFGEKFTPDMYAPTLAPLIASANQFGHALVVSQEVYPYKTRLEEFVASQKSAGQSVSVVYSKTEGNKSPADMCNQVVEYAHDKAFKLFAIVSGDLGQFIPSAIPSMLATIEENSRLATVGVAIQGVHNFGLLNEVHKEGVSVVQPNNFATVFHNNAFSVHRTTLEDFLPFENRLFPRVTDQGTLGTIDIDGEQIPVGGNEEIALMLRLLTADYFLQVNFLAGANALIRDPNKELTSIDKKVQRRIPVARKYQEHFGISDELLTSYLQGGGYRIHF